MLHARQSGIKGWRCRLIGIGIDIEDINRFKKYSLDNDLDFLNSIYSPNELKYCFAKKSPAKHLAARFCAKEAFIKALPNSINDIKFNEINITNLENGQPVITCEKFSNYKYLVSLSHEKEKAVAVVYIDEV